MDDTTIDRRIVVSETTDLADAFRVASSLLTRLREFADDVAEIILVLEQLIQEAQREQKRRRSITYPAEYWYVRYYDLGNEKDAVSYRSNIWNDENALDKSLRLLTERLQAACVIPPVQPASLGGRTEPFPGTGLFAFLPFIMGFYNFAPHWEDTKVLGDSDAYFCSNTFAQMHVSATLSSQDWQQLREAAAKRLFTRLCWWLELRKSSSHSSEVLYKDDKNFVYHRAYNVSDLRNSSHMANPIVASIINGEEGRLRRFVDALHGTLQVLSAVAALRRDVPSSEDTIAPERMIEFLRAVHAVLIGQAEAEILRYPFSTSVNATEAVTVVNSEPTVQAKVAGLHRQMQAKDEELTQTRAELRVANQQVEELKEQLAVLKPQDVSEKGLASYYGYKRRLQEAASSKRVHGVWPQWEIDFNNETDIRTLVYSFDPSAVAFSLSELAAVEVGKRQVISKDAFWHFAGVLGYPNFYQYLLQMKPNLLQMLLNLAIPGAQISEVWMLDADALEWSIRHPPQITNASNISCVPNIPCYVIKNPSHIWQEYTWRYVGLEIIKREKASLLDFRQSLYIAASLFASVLPEERDQQEQSFLPSQVVPYAVPPQFSDRRVQIVQETHDSALHRHHYFIEINDQANGVSQPIQVDFAVDDEGTIIPLSEEEEA